MMTETAKVEFEVGGKKYRIKKPSLRNINEAEKIYNRTFKDALDSGAILKLQMDDWLKQKGLWDDEKEQTIQKRRMELEELLDKVDRGGIKLSEAKELAQRAYLIRLNILSIGAYKNHYSYILAETQAEAAKFSYLLSECLVDAETSKKIYKDYDELLDSDNKELFEEASDQLSIEMYGDMDAYLSELPENKFLKSNGFLEETKVLAEAEEDSKEPVFLDDEGKPIKKKAKKPV